MRHSRAGTFRRLGRGLFDYPRLHKELGSLPPGTDDVASALSERDNSRLQLSGAHAANALGLSQQVPVRVVYLTDGASRTIRLGKRQIILKRTTPRQMKTAGRISGTVIQALRWLGQRNVDEQTIAALKRRLTKSEKEQLLADRTYAPAWIAKIMTDVTEPSEP